MKHALSYLAIFILFFQNSAQNFYNDSLDGFDLNSVMLQAHQQNFSGSELKTFLQIAKRNFLNEKYKLVDRNSASRYNGSQVYNVPCINEDFELSSAGTYTNNSSVNWIATQGNAYSYVCTASSLIPMTTNTSAVVIYNTPVNDVYLGTVGTSPFGGSNVAKLGNTGHEVARIRQTFPVFSSNWLYNYAYRGVLCDYIHGCCQDASLLFKFYDQAGNAINSMSRTVVMGTPSCVATATNNWVPMTTSLGVIYTTPNWEIVTVNLSAYTGSLVTVEVIAQPCISSAHIGYMYYDAKCSDGNALIVNESAFLSPASDFTSCVATATLAGMPGFTNYLWQGPSASGVTGSLNQSVTTNVAGIYTLTSSSGTLVSTQTLNLSFGASTIAINGNSSICQGGVAALQLLGTGISSYTWSTGTMNQSISVSPTITTAYAVAATNTTGCIYNAIQTVSLLAVPLLTIQSSANPVCPTQIINLSTQAPGIATFTWSNGTNGSLTVVNPSSTSVYSVAATSTNGCITSAFITTSVFPAPQLQIIQSSSSLCIGKQATLTAYGITGTTFNWSNGANTNSIVVTPGLTTIYTVFGTTSDGCSQSMSKTITVWALPQMQISTTNSEVCLGMYTNLSVSGASLSSVFWNIGSTAPSVVVNPTLTSIYSCSVTDINGCSASQSITINVHALPIGQIVTSSQNICAGASATLSVIGTGLTGYQWTTGQSTQSIFVTPPQTTQYSVVVTEANGCTSTTSITVTVEMCNVAAVEKYELNKKVITIFPNPNEGTFQIEVFQEEHIWLVDLLGQVISELQLNAENNFTHTFLNLPAGVYFVKTEMTSQKIIVN